MKEDFIKLTNSVYVLLEFFPESDPLKNRAKDKALEIMECLVLNSGQDVDCKEKLKNRILENIDVLLGYMWIGKLQGWLNPTNYLLVSEKYENIKKEIDSLVVKQELTVAEKDQKRTRTDVNPVLIKDGAQKKASVSLFSERQKKIIEFLEENNNAQVMDIQAILNNVTKRTIRRDLDQLLDMGKIVRTGDFNQVSYVLKR